MYGVKRVRRLHRKRKPGSIKWLLKILTFIFIFFSVYYFIHSSFFAVTSIRVIGAKEVSISEIVKLSGLSAGENIFKINRVEAEKKISMSPMIGEVQVKKRIPRRVDVIIRERIPAVFIPVAGGLMIVDGEGFILKKESELSKESLPIITGLDFPDTIAVGEKLDSEKLVMGLNMVAQMDERAKQEIEEIDVSDPQKLKAFTVQGAEIRLGNGDGFQEKFAQFLHVFSEEQKLGRLKDIEYIDVSFSGRTVVYYRNK